MFTSDWEYYTHCSRLKSRRTKTRVQKTALDKKLIHLHKQLKAINIAKSQLGLIELQPPVQKGWKRSFVLRPDVLRSKDASFFQALLEKINTVEYCDRKDFKVKKRKMGKKTYEVKSQNVREFFGWELQKIKLTEKERLYFKEEWRFGHNSGHIYKIHVFTEPWRYVLQIKPNIITHAKAIDPILEQQEKEIDNFILGHYLQPKLSRLLHGNYGYRDCWKENDKAKYDYIIKENMEIRQSRFSNEY